MLGGDGQAGERVLPHAEAQQGERYCEAAVHQQSVPSSSSLFVCFSWSKEGEKEEQEETAGETPCLPPTPGGGERTPSKSANATGQKFEKVENEEILYFVISLSKLVKFWNKCVT